MEQGIFSVKLYEMEQQYGKLQSRIQLCQSKDHERISEEIRQMEDEEAETSLLLQKRIKGSGYPAAARLAQAMFTYENSVKEILREAENGNYSREHRKTGDPEPAILYAEYAADFATQSMRYALRASIQALELYASVAGESRQAQNGTEDQHGLIRAVLMSGAMWQPVLSGLIT